MNLSVEVFLIANVMIFVSGFHSMSANYFAHLVSSLLFLLSTELFIML